MGLWDRTVAFLLSWWNVLCVLWARRFYVRAVLTFLALPVGVAGALVLFWTLFGLAFGFLALHWADMALFVGVPVCFFSWLATRKPKGTDDDKKPVRPSDALVIERAKQGLVALAEIVFAVLRDLAEFMPIVSPRDLSGLYCPRKSACIWVKDGVAIISMMVYFKQGFSDKEFNRKQFVEAFNLRMGQRLDARDLPNLPNPVFYDSKNNPHTSIQAIDCTPCGEYLKLEIVRVNEEAVALIESIELAKSDDDGAPPAPPVSPYF